MLPALFLALAAPALALPAPLFDAARILAPRADLDLDLASSAAASLIAYFPKISSPSKGSVWQAGGALEVAWNATKPDYPANQIHTYAEVYLGFLNPEDPASGYNLDISHPLGNVSFYDGSGTASLPLPANLPTRSTYLITMGSTNNISPLFTIEGTAAAASSASSSASSAPASASSTSSGQIEARPITVYFPDGESTVLGGTSSAAAGAATSTSSAAAPEATTLHDIAAGAAPASSSSSSSAAAPTGGADSPTATVLSSTAAAPASASSSASTSSSSAPASSSASPAVASGTAPSAIAAAAQTTSAKSGSARTLLSGTAVGLAGVVALLVL